MHRFPLLCVVFSNYAIHMKLEEPDLQRISEVLATYGPTLSPDEVAALLKVKRATVLGMLRNDGDNPDPDPLPGYKSGKLWYVVNAELLEWCLRHRNTTL